MGQQLTKFVKQNIDSYFRENDDGTVTIKFANNPPIKLGSSSANFLKQILTKKLNGDKNMVAPPSKDIDMVSELNQIATEMIRSTGLTPSQRKELEIKKLVKKVK